ncbi:hypothetical protein QBC39DRAFT_6171 [Podospora conica]|nr:hypothetical protein QBC39DRAFT_6171 [Schizothecium conicum]
MPTIPGGSPAPTSLIVPETDPLFPDNDDPLGSTSPSNRKLVITLSSVLSVVGLLLLLGALLLCRRRRRGSRKPLFSRTISPIDDDEIATWKVPHMSRAEKAAALDDADSPPPTAAAPTTPTRNPNPTTSPHTTHTKDQPSTSSLAPLRKPPSAVIVYSNPHGHHRRCSSDDSYYNLSSASPPGSGGTRKMSFDKVLPQTPIQARAPNAIPGLTDESVPGAMPFVEVVPHHHHQRRLSKVRSSHHVRARSSRSFAAAGGDVWEGGRHSHDYLPRGYHGGVGGHWRVGSASEGQQQHMQQRARGVSFDDDGRGGGGGGWRGGYGEGEIGRAIG